MAKLKSEQSHAILDEKSRRYKAEKILKVIAAKIANPKGRLLDVGTGSGHVAYYLGADPDLTVCSVDVVDERIVSDNYTFKLSKDETIPYEDSSFDIVVTNHVIEHVLDQRLHMQEITRVLRDDGVIYLATPNKYWIFDPHYVKLPFISWFPRRISTFYLKVLRNKEWDISPLSTMGIARLAKENALKATNVTPEIVKKPQDYNLDVYKGVQPIAKRIPRALLNRLAFLLPTHIFMLEPLHPSNPADSSASN